MSLPEGTLPAGGLIEARDEEERAALIEAGRLLFARNCAFFTAAQGLDHLPPPEGIEVALAGRSNVGKSSLTNALTGQTHLARVSVTPGRTKQLNFFRVEDSPLTLVDMPGYGYAKASKTVKEDWQGLMFDFLRGRPNLRRVLLLMDARVETKSSDTAVMDLLDRAAVPFQLVITKADGVKPDALAKRRAEVEALARKHPAGHPLVITTSSETGMGIDELRAEMAALAV
jgi:GTP-binding protein